MIRLGKDNDIVTTVHTDLSDPHEKDRAPVCRKAENNRTGLIFSACDHIVEQLVDTALPTKNHTKDGTDRTLCDFIGKLDHSVLKGTVYEGLAKGITDHHDDCTYGNADTGSKLGTIL